MGGSTKNLPAGHRNRARHKEQIEKAIEIERFSDEYFDLLKKLGDDSKDYLAEDTNVLVVLKGKAYLIVEPKAKKKK